MRTVIFLGLIFIGGQIGESNGAEGHEAVVNFFAWIFLAAAVMDIVEFFDNLKKVNKK